MKNAIITAAVLISLLAAHTAAQDRRIYDVEEITVSSGTTWWEIAAEYSPSDMDKREYIFNAKKLNQRTSSDLYVGERVKVMRYE